MRRPPAHTLAAALAACMLLAGCSSTAATPAPSVGGATPAPATPVATPATTDPATPAPSAQGPIPLVDAVAGMHPEAVWRHFAELNAIPRASHAEGKASAFVADFGRGLGYTTTVNDVGDVIIEVPATAGMEDRPGVVLQAHLDMVAQKTADTTFDFATDPIASVLDGDWVHATGTTLGSDDGSGVAMIMALIEAEDVAHGPIEALFTVDEEDGFAGVNALKPGDLTFRSYINIDNETEGQFLISSAGGVYVNAAGTYKPVAAPAGSVGVTITVDGLLGGHSGIDINKGRGSAHQLLAQLLDGAPASLGLRLASIAGGSQRNAIPRTASAVVAVPADQLDALRAYVADAGATAAANLAATDPGVTITAADADAPVSVMAAADQAKVVAALTAVPQGVFAMSPDVPDMPETSTNLGLLVLGDGTWKAESYVRSSQDDERDAEARLVAAAFAGTGAKVVLDGAYSGWPANPDSKILALMKATYASVFGSEPAVAAVHAGLETSVAGVTFPGMDMISIGPTTTGVHSPDERLEVASVQRVWDLLVATLAAIK
ncbi:MAG: aminoacyl-histidine dipeptidase [Chloroflexota bacterium]